MRKMFLSPYKLRNRLSGQSRQGYLVKVEDNEFKNGYADIFPWPEFGDPRFEEIPQRLKAGELSPLLKKSLLFAKKDGLAREKKQSLSIGKNLKNHRLVTDLEKLSLDFLSEALELGFKRFKVKVCRQDNEIKNLLKIAKNLPEEVLLRLDCNQQGSSQFFEQLEELRPKIEFIEDPFVNFRDWGGDWPFAYDQASFSYEDVQVDWQILKPAKQLMEEAKASRVIFTSYMDHPVGVAHAFVEALEYGEQLYDYGLMSHQVYEETEFHKYLLARGPLLELEEEFGIGFTSVLATPSTPTGSSSSAGRVATARSRRASRSSSPTSTTPRAST